MRSSLIAVTLAVLSLREFCQTAETPAPLFVGNAEAAPHGASQPRGVRKCRFPACRPALACC